MILAIFAPFAWEALLHAKIFRLRVELWALRHVRDWLN